MYAATMALSQAKGLESMVRAFGEELRIRARVDAQAAIGLSHRAGLGNARHTETPEIWIQDASERREFEVRKCMARAIPPIYSPNQCRMISRIGTWSREVDGSCSRVPTFGG